MFTHLFLRGYIIDISRQTCISLEKRNNLKKCFSPVASAVILIHRCYNIALVVSRNESIDKQIKAGKSLVSFGVTRVNRSTLQRCTGECESTSQVVFIYFGIHS